VAQATAGDGDDREARLDAVRLFLDASRL